MIIKSLPQILSISFFTLGLAGCTTTTLDDRHLPASQPKRIIIQQQATTAPSAKYWLKQPPADYIVWLNQDNNQQRVARYEQFLKDNKVDGVVPMYQLLRSARDWQKCNSTPYAVPSAELWSNSLATIKILKFMVDSNVLRDFEVTSVYRDYSLNICAGGAPRSKHVYNAAIDFRLGPEGTPSTEDLLIIEDTKIKLCNFWRDYGQSLNMGLGVYASGQIHIDTQGYRTWGPDLTRNTSICHF
ncbi:peptidase M15 [Acinetobacter qingfengensis]|uniref:Peptidase M15 n=1 Tax=Acinetobacter qingfengensis TaxID=1262585 RepID=A0A1E7R3E4_9GAMM|nr:D-Ala-D-Ala carboxypeptidase family metallohydrolase [Acinetobacter qingfengensis]KAA8734820.1 peptidase M15 [Acinetobacter qingfengensis]OEY93816.1 peptidase M15 [Acinetobacter qingfengensis]